MLEQVKTQTPKDD